MRLVFIYGPPAVGKLTVARELASLTAFKLFHNHVSIDFVRSIFPFGTPAYQRIIDRYRREMLDEAAKEKIDTIFTFVYGRPEDDEFVKDIVKRVESHDGRVLFVRLFCARDALALRVTIKGRKEQGKMSDEQKLSKLLKDFDLDSEVPAGPSLSLDTTILSPKKLARRIAEHYDLSE